MNMDDTSHDDNKIDLDTWYSHEKEKWMRHRIKYHTHFDCFSGAAGDMMLAACFDVAGQMIMSTTDDTTTTTENHSNDIHSQYSQNVNKFQSYIIQCLQYGLPQLANEFDIIHERLWRSQLGSIAAIHVRVKSIYHHQPISAPKRHDVVVNTHDDHDHHHEHYHHHHENSDEHSHQHHTNDDHIISPAIPLASLPISGNSRQNNDHDHEHEHDHQSSPMTTQNLQMNHHHQHDDDHFNHEDSLPIRNLPVIRQMLLDSSEQYIPIWVRDKAILTFTLLAKAEAAVHGATDENAVHFHEVGAIDSIIDTVGTLLALYTLGIHDSISCSRIPFGEGMVGNTAHGVLPVPSPATLYLMKGIATCPGPPGYTGELVTPTGMALLRALLTTTTNDNNKTNQHDACNKMKGIPIGRPPPFTICYVGVGAGTKDFREHPNVIRLIVGALDDSN